MKTSAIIRIILFSIGIFLLLGVLGMGLGLTTFMVDHSETVWHTSMSSSALQTGTPTDTIAADPSMIQSIEIEWAAGSITIAPSEEIDRIQICETDVAEKHRMTCTQSGSTLTIRFSKKSSNIISFGTDTVSKDLTILVPAGWVCQSLELDVAAADVSIRDMTIGELDFDGASGFCNLENCHVTDVDVDAASGDLSFSGSLENLDFDGASADCQLMLTNCPRHIDLDGMSGELDITLPSDCGFTVRAEGLSSSFSTDFKTTSHNGSHVHGDGSCLIELDALSGTVTIHDGGYNCHEGGNDHHTGHH